MNVSGEVTVEPRSSLVGALRSPQYRLLWISTLAFYLARWMDVTVITWLVLELTNSPLLVGLVGVRRFASMLLGPFCGTIADRLDRRRILLTIQSVYCASSVIMTVLFLTSWLQTWHLFVFAIIAGLSHTFELATRFPMATDIVKERQLANATSLLFAGASITGMFGPLLGGSLLETIKGGGCFALIAVSLLISVLPLLRLKIAPKKILVHESVWKNLVDGLYFIKKEKRLLTVIIISILINMFLIPYWYTTIPVFARDILHTEASGYGLLMASIGLGAVIGALIASLVHNTTNMVKLFIVATFTWPAILIIVAISRVFILSSALLILTGVAQGISMAFTLTLLLMWSPPEMRGRVTGARALAIGVLPLGNLI